MSFLLHADCRQDLKEWSESIEQAVTIKREKKKLMSNTGKEYGILYELLMI